MIWPAWLSLGELLRPSRSEEEQDSGVVGVSRERVADAAWGVGKRTGGPFDHFLAVLEAELAREHDERLVFVRVHV